MFVRKSYSGLVHVNKGGFYTQQGQQKCNKHVDELMKYDKMRHIILSAFDTHLRQFKMGQFDLLNQGFDREEALRLGQLLTGNDLSTFSAKNTFKFLKSKTLFSYGIDSALPCFISSKFNPFSLKLSLVNSTWSSPKSIP